MFLENKKIYVYEYRVRLKPGSESRSFYIYASSLKEADKKIQEWFEESDYEFIERRPW